MSDTRTIFLHLNLFDVNLGLTERRHYSSAHEMFRKGDKKLQICLLLHAASQNSIYRLQSE